MKALISILLFYFFSGSSVYAKFIDTEPFQVDLNSYEIKIERTNHLGLHQEDVLMKDNKGYFFNNRNLGKKLPTEIADIWSSLVKGPDQIENGFTNRKSSCSSGNYIYSKMIKTGLPGKIDQRRGCTEGKLYARMIQKIRRLKDYAGRI
jgi:hypothetical protein